MRDEKGAFSARDCSGGQRVLDGNPNRNDMRPILTHRFLQWSVYQRGVPSMSFSFSHLRLIYTQDK